MQRLLHRIPHAIALLALFASVALAAERKVPRGREKPCGYGKYYTDREKPLALIDHPLRDPSICRGPDGVYYLTGTDGTPAVPGAKAVDFDNNDGIRLWRSKDLETWEPLGKVFDIVTWARNEKLNMPWWRYPAVKPGAAFSPLVRGVLAPEIHHLTNTFFIVFSIGGAGVGILKSTTGKAEGPYELLSPAEDAAKHSRLVRPIVHEGGSPSLFADEDGKIYLIWGQGLIAPLKDDLTALAAAPTQLVCTPAQGAGFDAPRTVGQSGFHVFKADKKYWLVARHIGYRDQYAASDVFVASSDSLMGPYTPRRWMIPHAGETTIFPGPSGELLATFSGGDEESALIDRPGIVPLKWEEDKPRGSTTAVRIPRIAAGVHTERGCWEKILPITDYAMRDVQCIRAPDGFYYYTGSCDDPHFAGRLAVFRSKDLVDWEEFTLIKLDDLPWLSAKSLAARKASSARAKGRTLDDKFMDAEIHFLKGTFYCVYALYDLKNAALGDPEPGTAHAGVYFMRSKSGKIDGPWENLGRLAASQASFFEDSDGTVYLCSGRYHLAKMKPNLTGRDGEPRQILPADGSHAFTDVGACLHKIRGKYVYFSCGFAHSGAHEPIPSPGDGGLTSYNYSCMTADSPFGPYSRAKMAVDYGGHGGLFQDAAGRWWAAFFATDGQHDFRRHMWAPAGIVPLEVFEKDGQLILRVAQDLPPDYAAALTKKRAALQSQIKP